MKLTKQIAAVSLVLVALVGLSGCGTVHGFGQDVSTVGHGIQKAAN